MATLTVVSQIGEFTILLSEDRAPVTCAYFSDLVRSRAFDHSGIFRILATSNHKPGDSCPIHVVQVGPRQGLFGDRHPIMHEGTNITGIPHKKWTVSAARFDLGELYGSFFICMRDEPALDYGGSRQPDGQGFAAFGHVVAGFETIEGAYNRAEIDEILRTEIPIHTVSVNDAGLKP